MTSLTGTSTLIRLALRRERLALPLWTGLIALLVVGTALGLGRLYPTPEAQALFAGQINRTPAEVALLGGVLAPTLGGLIAWRVGVSVSVLAGLMGLLTVVRHTRAEEEAGRLELVGAGVIGRAAPLTAALAVALGAHLALATLVAAGLAAQGLKLSGSVALGLTLALSGAVFTALAGVTAQLAAGAQTAGLLVGAALGAAYLLRVVGDMAGWTWLSWLSPLGWARFARPFAGEAWWALAPPLVLTAGLSALAYALSARRDLGAGWVRPRPGPATAAPNFRGLFALAWRLQRGWLLSWTAAFALFGAVFGGVATSAARQLDAGARFAGVLTNGSPTAPPEALLFTLVLMILGGEVAAVCAVGSALRPRAEEVQGRADPLLGAPVGRIRWAASHLVFALLGPAALLATFGATAGLTYGIGAGGAAHEAGRVTLAALAYLPAVWVLTAVAVALFGLLPRHTFLAWGALALVALIDLARELNWVGDAAAQFSPFAHVPKLLLGQPADFSLLGLLGAACALTALGLVGLRGRDIGQGS